MSDPNPVARDGSAADSSREKGTHRIRILTLNVWALPITVPFQDKRARTARLPDALRSVDADIIVLQEIFDTSVRRAVVDALADRYQVARDALAYRKSLGITFDIHGGILVLSRLELGDTQFVPHPLPDGSKLTERLGRKGTLFSTVKYQMGQFALAAPHFYAGTKPADSLIRRQQVEAFLNAVDRVHPNQPVVLAGDLNFPPANYDDGRVSEMELLVAAGFRDTIEPSQGQQAVTWSFSRNRYARNWLQTHKTDERFDYVLVREGRHGAIEPVTAGIVLDEAGAEVSDHYGVVAELTLSH